MVRILSRVVVAMLALASAALAEHEVHIVAVGKGQQSELLYGLPEAHVLVDRPGQSVSLVLLGGGPILWNVAMTPDTIIDGILIGGSVSGQSKVLLSGIPMLGTRTPDLPLVYRPVGRDFRAMVEQLTRDLATDRIHGFQSQHIFTGDPIKVDHADMVTVSFQRDSLSMHLGTLEDLPSDLKRWVETGGEAEAWDVTFGPSGFTLGDAAGVRKFPVPANMPKIFLPVAGTYDPVSQRLFGVSYGGEGLIYAVDVQTGEWSVITDLASYDPAALLFDPHEQVLVLTGAFSRPGEIRIIGLDGTSTEVMIPITAFPGLTDLFDFGNEFGPPLMPRLLRNGWLLLEARGTESSVYPDTGPYRIYAAHIQTGDVRLLRYHID